MSPNKLKYYIFLFCISMIFAFTSCKKDYLTDGGLASANTTYTTYEYLANNEYHYFDTLIQIIDHLGLKDSVNNAGTFFAPTDFAINKLMSNNSITSLDRLYKKINSKFLTQYMFADSTITLDNVSTSAKMYTNWADSTCAIKKLAQSYSVVTSSLTYYILEYVKINGVLDGSAGAPSNDATDLTLQCQTTGIKTASGTNLNVFANNASINLVGDPVKDTTVYNFNINVVQDDNDYTNNTLQLDSNAIAKLFDISTSQISSLLDAGSDSLKLYAIEPDGTFSDNYTADTPGFWFGSDGSVVNWGDDAVIYADYLIDSYQITVGQFPSQAVLGQTYVLKLALLYINSDGDKKTAYININVKLVSQ
ncbi:DUF4859 domain-containing protein [Rhizosphaericola mali]|uniref:DUF4859 domain-containing protein n=1 Tax=Rhizosphaericola mali TaxID=2545455 RepID=A0A5P2G5M7_9BACT|nr:DUF4859 domain-containing protein [Rhizosphaericola mali]QES89122.1 DUF4859 domain-containing protein [Rhizosphaericola mali]